MEIDLPYKAEYAKTGRASCKACKSNIGQGTLRMAAMVQSAFHDGKQPNWFHFACFFKKQRPSSVGDIQNFENLRFEDQEKVQVKVAEVASVVAPSVSGKKGKKRTKTENAVLNDFGIENAKSGRAACRGCEQKILKDQVRIRKTVYDTEVGMKYGGQALWHHLECFSKLREELGWFESGEYLPGFAQISKDDQAEVRKILIAINSEPSSAPKKVKLESQDDSDKEADKKLIDLVKKQSKLLFKFRDSIKNDMRKPDMIELLECNGQTPVTGDSEKLLDQISDLVSFGAIAHCQECKGTQILFQKSGYLCNGQLTEWTKCAKLIKEPPRSACKIPKHLKSMYSFLQDVPKKPEIRAVRYIAPSASTITKNVALKRDDDISGPKINRERPPLYLFQFAHIGLKEHEEVLKKRIMKLGGKLETKISEKTVVVLSTHENVKKMGSRMEKVMELGIHVLPMDYLDSVEANPKAAVSLINSMTLCEWGTDPSARINLEESKSLKSKSIYTKSVPKSVKLTVKNGLAVDPDSELQDISHVYVKDKKKYNAVLGLTDIQNNKNSYYKLQLLEGDSKNRYWVFRSWGRIGTTIGGTKLEKFSTAYEAIRSFESLYSEKSGNDFYAEFFKKVPGRMYPIDVEYGEDPKINLSHDHGNISKLEPAVQSLIKLLFDVDTMKRTMLEFDLDLEKMPLGKLSQKQIKSAYQVLTNVFELIEKGGSNAEFIDATNRFFTLIPHNFGVQNPPLLDTSEQIEKLRLMLDSLMEIECAYNLLKTEDIKNDENPLDMHYEQLKTQLEPLDKNSDEFALMQKYVQNTHAETHKVYELQVVDIFKVTRQGEARRFKPFKKLQNRKLLWHGSRLTNFVGILSHGLKIAPPEAPATGYMFGKGIYFADMVSKSANYCCTSQQNSTGLMLLSEVALGDMMECTAAKYVTNLPKNKDSCFGKGRTMPDPKESHFRKDGVEIPLGKPITDAKLQSALLYNEYIVYDIAQVNIQYLFRMNFNYKY